MVDYRIKDNKKIKEIESYTDIKNCLSCGYEFKKGDKVFYYKTPLFCTKCRIKEHNFSAILTNYNRSFKNKSLEKIRKNKSMFNTFCNMFIDIYRFQKWESLTTKKFFDILGSKIKKNKD